MAFRNSDKSSNIPLILEVPEIYYKICGATSIVNDGTYITIKSNGMPDHTSPYYAQTSALYKTYAGTTPLSFNFAINPNTMASQNLTFKIPLNPTEATGAIGVALNGVPLYNQYAELNNNTPLTN